MDISTGTYELGGWSGPTVRLKNFRLSGIETRFVCHYADWATIIIIIIIIIISHELERRWEERQ